MSLGNGCYKNLDHWCQGAAFRLPISIKWPSNKEDHNADYHNKSKNYICSYPAHIILKVHDDRGAKHYSAAKATVPPVEVGQLLLSLLQMVVVKLICPEALERGLVASSAGRDQVYGNKEDYLVYRQRFVAGVNVTGFQTWDELR